MKVEIKGDRQCVRCGIKYEKVCDSVDDAIAYLQDGFLTMKYIKEISICAACYDEWKTYRESRIDGLVDDFISQKKGDLTS